uniref:Metallophosphoesterase 1 n=1 Tax=Pogona vitticeps TaxID=103695 RepID=A0A6J0TLV2_9SAUR|nr:metallophosphoesterase 1 [Pogona vitticeps]XP_020649188.1 metallophosphoesterase 1 [Pogona vitticeps]XP_020649189.1 metallophosphoesterase 1 [Pogona vitticeps]
MAVVSLSIVHTFSWRKRSTFALILLSVILSVFVFCEFLIYYIVIIQCQWPQLKSQSSTASKQTPDSILKAMFLSDTHLLGQVNGHWLDKLRREWQMERAFQTALWLLQPEIVFILGDAFDEGKWSSSEAWSDDVRRFQKMFRHSADTELIVIVGNHDIGFHYEMTAFKLGRFLKVFNFTSEKLITRKGINFVTVNSIALEGDGCMICKEAEAKLTELSHRLNCSLQDQSQYQKRCSGVDIPPASAPILLQHYPLYRESDSKCTGDDSAPPDKKNDLFREKYDVLSREASQKLLWWFHPRLILSGHTHSACEVLHNRRTPEISIPSFSWRNRNNPSFIMGSITSADFSLYKCFLPFEITVITVYCIAGTVLVVLILARFQPHISPVHFVQRLITKYKAL